MTNPQLFESQMYREVIRQYDESKCCCISILTDKNFGGSLNDILIAKKITSKPIIRKDFIINKAQILESKIYGADAILLIAKILTKKEVKLDDKHKRKIKFKDTISDHSSRFFSWNVSNTDKTIEFELINYW